MMPLLMMCGYPCSGKSLVVQRLVDAIASELPDYITKVIHENPSTLATHSSEFDPRTPVYADSRLERELRAQHKSEIERALTAATEKMLVISDAANYVKGYRYELYCLAKSLRHQHAVMLCATPEPKVVEWNAKIGRYPEDLLSNMISRFEHPQSTQRWDSPLLTCHPDLCESANSIDGIQLLQQLTASLLRVGRSSVKPNRATQLSIIAPNEMLQEMERVTQQVIDHILACQSYGSECASLPPILSDKGVASTGEDSEATVCLTGRLKPFTLPDLIRLKRHFICIQRTKAAEKSATPFDAVATGVAFLRFINCS